LFYVYEYVLCDVSEYVYAYVCVFLHGEEQQDQVLVLAVAVAGGLDYIEEQGLVLALVQLQ